ncbi:hypothetical protein [Trinickia acidisoli]|uniref:hypothetical protein n=1 Tax=Trinickia acidisoli TaxID=2767482 RepID=UPI001A8D3522|nr:hypothetical protein [Trinickia acidisoli]
MRRLNASLALAAVACLGISGAAQAAHWRVGVYWGAPGPYYYPYAAPVVPAPYYYAPYPPPVVVTPDDGPDTTYVERPQPGAEGQSQDEPPQGTWWYCDKTKTYYPYVKQCVSGWREVPANPPAPSR